MISAATENGLTSGWPAIAGEASEGNRKPARQSRRAANRGTFGSLLENPMWCDRSRGPAARVAKRLLSGGIADGASS